MDKQVKLAFNKTWVLDQMLQDEFCIQVNKGTILEGVTIFNKHNYNLKVTLEPDSRNPDYFIFTVKQAEPKETAELYTL